jgi:hypothetical protein
LEYLSKFEESQPQVFDTVKEKQRGLSQASIYHILTATLIRQYSHVRLRDNRQYGKCFEVLKGLIQVSRRPPCPVTCWVKYSTPKMVLRSMDDYLVTACAKRPVV